MYDYLIVGAGLFGSVFAHQASLAGKKCLVIDIRDHIGGNCYTKKTENINIHCYGPHIFHTNSDKVWNYIKSLTEMRQFIYSPIARYKDDLFSLPFNMWTFRQLWNIKTPEEALQKIQETCLEISNPKNLEEHVLSSMGKDVYEKLIYGYTKKQWRMEPRELPKFIIERLPFRLTYDSNYYRDKYTAMPIDGYTNIFKKLLSDAEVMLGIDYFKDRSYWNSKAKTVVYTGKIDQYFDYTHGDLDYRTLRFEHHTIDKENFQGVPVVNWTSDDVEWTRTIEHKHFENSKSKKTILTYEIPEAWSRDKIPYYPINNQINNNKYHKYNLEKKQHPNVIFGGRLACYKYYDMDQVIASSLTTFEKHIKGA